MVVESKASLKEDYATIRELAASKNLVAVVRGTISATRDVYLDRFAFRILTVDVTEGLRGQADAQISVLEEGGVVPYALAAKDIPAKDSDSHAPQSTKAFIDFRFLGARHSEPGDQVVLFLGRNPNTGTVIETTYNMISSVHGRFTYDTRSNAFVRSLGSPDRELRTGFVKTADIARSRPKSRPPTRDRWPPETLLGLDITHDDGPDALQCRYRLNSSAQWHRGKARPAPPTLAPRARLRISGTSAGKLRRPASSVDAGRRSGCVSS